MAAAGGGQSLFLHSWVGTDPGTQVGQQAQDYTLLPWAAFPDCLTSHPLTDPSRVGEGKLGELWAHRLGQRVMGVAESQG